MSNLERAAAALREARLSRRQIAPIAATYGLGSIDEAYAVAALNTAARLAEGRRVIGRKIGLTAKSVQRQLGVDQPDFGVLFDDMELLDRDIVPSERLMQPKVEAEIAFVIGRDLQRPAASWGEFVSAIDGAFQLAAVEAVLSCNGKAVSQGQGSACLGHPLRAAYWLACEMARRGEGMGAGEIILSGALGPTAPVKSGDLIEADFGAFGRVACRFT